MVNFSLYYLYRCTTSLVWEAGYMALIVTHSVSVGSANGFPLLIGFKSDTHSTISGKPRLWSQVMMAMS